MNVLGWNEVQKLLNGLEVLVVLAEGILKRILMLAMFEGDLSPDRRGRVCVNPAAVMLRFDHKYATP